MSEHAHAHTHADGSACSCQPETGDLTAIDPICGMSVKIATAKHTAEHAGQTYYFCSTGCQTKFVADPACEIRIDSAFEQVILACASGSRPGQRGTWIVPAMRRAYIELHQRGFAHSVETWVQGQLTGGLYCVALGQALFGESMFTRVSGASRIALAALVALCRAHGIGMIDCQQNTAHLSLLGAREVARADFCQHMALAQTREGPVWKFEPLYWKYIPS